MSPKKTLNTSNAGSVGFGVPADSRPEATRSAPFSEGEPVTLIPTQEAARVTSVGKTASGHFVYTVKIMQAGQVKGFAVVSQGDLARRGVKGVKRWPDDRTRELLVTAAARLNKFERVLRGYLRSPGKINPSQITALYKSSVAPTVNKLPAGWNTYLRTHRAIVYRPPGAGDPKREFEWVRMLRVAVISLAGDLHKFSQGQPVNFPHRSATRAVKRLSDPQAIRLVLPVQDGVAGVYRQWLAGKINPRPLPALSRMALNRAHSKLLPRQEAHALKLIANDINKAFKRAAQYQAGRKEGKQLAVGSLYMALSTLNQMLGGQAPPLPRVARSVIPPQK